MFFFVFFYGVFLCVFSAYFQMFSAFSVFTVEITNICLFRFVLHPCRIVANYFQSALSVYYLCRHHLCKHRKQIMGKKHLKTKKPNIHLIYHRRAKTGMMLGQIKCQNMIFLHAQNNHLPQIPFF